MHLLKAIGLSLRTGWLILGMTLITVLVIEMSARLALAARTEFMDWLRAEHWIADLRKHRFESQAGAPWLHDFLREERATQFVQRPYVHWRRRPYQGRYLNIDRDGLRATWNPPLRDNPDDPSSWVRIFTFGGSAMWGWNARDDHTVASYLSKLLHERGYRVQVTNYGEASYISTQEVITLLRCIQRGEVPDIAVFYDGFNEINQAYLGTGRGGLLIETEQQPKKSSTRGLWADGRAFLRGNLWGSRRVVKGLQRRFLSSSVNTGPRPIPLDEERIRRILRRYQTNLTFVEALGRYYGFEFLFYWQPTLHSKQRRSPYEQTIGGPYFIHYEKVFDDFYRRVRESRFLNSHPRFHDLSALFDDSEAPYYVDAVHLSEAGNRLVAEAMTEAVSELIEQRRAAVEARAIR